MGARSWPLPFGSSVPQSECPIYVRQREAAALKVIDHTGRAYSGRPRSGGDADAQCFLIRAGLDRRGGPLPNWLPWSAERARQHPDQRSIPPQRRTAGSALRTGPPRGAPRGEPAPSPHARYSEALFPGQSKTLPSSQAVKGCSNRVGMLLSRAETAESTPRARP